MHERRFQKKVVDALREAGALVLNKVGSEAEGPGWPDLYIAHVAWTGWLELKTGFNWPTRVQNYRIAQLTERGVPAYLLRTVTTMSNVSIELYVPTNVGLDVTWVVRGAGLQLDNLLVHLHDITASMTPLEPHDA